MVKNYTGGSKTKSQARKNISISSNKMRTRISEDDCECYAQVEACLGNDMIHVMCIDGKKRLCHIRGSFRGKSRRDNNAKKGSWLLVGLREYETQRNSSKQKLENCDLLEVYNDSDKDKLKELFPTLFKTFIDNDNVLFDKNTYATDVEFTTETEDEYMNLVLSTNNKTENNTILEETEEEINVDDI
jgi:translation initiation factor 1A